MSIKIEISYGELLDKITILQIKQERITDPEKLENIGKELEILSASWSSSPSSEIDVESEMKELRGVNEKLWEIEDAIREKEAKKEFDEKFIELARAVYINNDERARLKRRLNIKLGSGLQEEKSYSDYQRAR